MNKILDFGNYFIIGDFGMGISLVGCVCGGGMGEAKAIIWWVESEH